MKTVTVFENGDVLANTNCPWVAINVNGVWHQTGGFTNEAMTDEAFIHGLEKGWWKYMGNTQPSSDPADW